MGQAKRRIPVWTWAVGPWGRELLVLSGLFLLGVLGGCLAVSWVGTGWQGFSDRVSHYLSGLAAEMPNGPDWAAALWDSVRYPFCTMLLGMTALGAVGIPLLFLARGFFLSFASGAFVALYGSKGLWVALGFLGIQALLTVPVLFAAGVQCWRHAWALAMDGPRRGKGAALFPGCRNRRGFVLCILVLLLCGVYERYVHVRLLTLVAAWMVL